jgi:hypothetical protein
MTIVTTTTPEVLQAVKAGRNFFLLYTKVEPQIGQPLMLQTATEEFKTTVELVHSTHGLMKHWYLLAWNVGVVVPTLERL